MAQAKGAKPTRVKVRDHRERLRAQGLRPIQIWEPDVRASSFRSEAHRHWPWRQAPMRPRTRRLNQAVMVFLGLAVSPRTGRKRQR